MATTTAAPLTLEEFSRLPRGEARHELNAGELITIPPSKFLYSRVARKLFKILEAYLEKSGAAKAFQEAGYILTRNPLTIRQPDVSIVSTEQSRSTGDEDYLEGAPQLAAEVVSPSDSPQDLEVKIKQYLQSGAQQVWVLYPKVRRMHIFYANGSTAILEETETVNGGDLLPGFSVKVADLFYQ